MPTKEDIEFIKATSRALAKAGLRKVKPRIREASRTLSRAAHVLQHEPRESWIYIPHYWAVMVHDGRGPFSKNFIMVWFRNPHDDPRLRAGTTPVRVAQLGRLSPQQFRKWQRLNRLADPTGKHPRLRPMIVTTRIKKATVANEFFDNKKGMRGFSTEASQIVQERFSAHIRREIPGVPVELVDEAVASLG